MSLLWVYLCKGSNESDGMFVQRDWTNFGLECFGCRPFGSTFDFLGVDKIPIGIFIPILFISRLHELGQTEIRHFRSVVIGDQHIARRNVSMNNVILLQVSQSFTRITKSKDRAGWSIDRRKITWRNRVDRVERWPIDLGWSSNAGVNLWSWIQWRCKYYCLGFEPRRGNEPDSDVSMIWREDQRWSQTEIDRSSTSWCRLRAGREWPSSVPWVFWLPHECPDRFLRTPLRENTDRSSTTETLSLPANSPDPTSLPISRSR